jgi:hypothetical protein
MLLATYTGFQLQQPDTVHVGEVCGSFAALLRHLRLKAAWCSVLPTRRNNRQSLLSPPKARLVAEGCSGNPKTVHGRVITHSVISLQR